ncbi:retropepsin-like aspartic protease family protein [Teredinibacter franksiae]|uniref:retropepsin-like aspartic protease family protein n=1 Tax=Teredinibacter franksiae TaxID=2761453 RepID=UPI001627857A|nr:TIGR02281 family clan AA aspartic protease [Teredinibacter franksiae]
MTDNPPPGKGLGKGMLTLSWVLVLAGLTLFFASREENLYNPNQQLEGGINGSAREVVLERNRYGHYVATGKINGHPVTFMLDTGATHVAIPANLGRKLQLKQGARFPVSTANGTVQVWSTSIDSLELGPIKLNEVRASLNPGMDGDEILLGMSALKTLDFSQQGKYLTLRQHLN